MADKLFSYGGFKLMDKKTFRLSAKLQMGSEVKLDTGTEDYVNAATGALANSLIGWIMPDEEYEANNGTDYVSSGDIANIALRGPVLSLICGTVIAVGDVCVFHGGTTGYGTVNRWVLDVEGIGGGTVPTAVSLQAGSDGTKVDMVYLG